jgi:predicted CXXCH cytochrome family protein
MLAHFFTTPVPCCVRFLAFALLASLAGCGGESSRGAGKALVRGTVTGRESLAGATVVFVDAFSAAERASLQPLEDLAAGAEFRAPTDENGDFSAEVPAGRYFVFVLPPAGDALHLPGGSLSRRSVDLARGTTAELEIALSESAPSGARYVGSTRCLECHPDQAQATQTLHFLGLRRLGAAGTETSPLQDLAAFPQHDAALAYFDEPNPFDNTGPADGYGFRIPSSEGYNVLLGRDEAGFFQAIEDAGSGIVSELLYVLFTYGGEGRFRHRFITRLDAAGRFTRDAAAGSYQVLPAQFNETRGTPERRAEVTAPGWVLYEPQRWAGPATGGEAPSRTPRAAESFDAQCAGCHFTGMRLERGSDGLFHADAVDDPGGALDYDGDGTLDEINIGCERCHGPGSRHVEEGRGSIVQPRFLSPGRATMLCGQCHMSGRGNGSIDGGGRGQYPSRNSTSGEVEFPRAGLSPAEFFGTPDGAGILPSFGTRGGFFDTPDLSRDETSSWTDRSAGFGAVHDHSREIGQEYFDHVRSGHALNRFEIVACFDCHESHGRRFRAQTSADPDSNALCLHCHAGSGDFAGVSEESARAVEDGLPHPEEVKEATHRHVTLRTFDLIGVAMNLGPSVYARPQSEDALGRCTTCHMPKTARAGSWVADADGFVIRGDVSSHTFDNISPRVSEAMAAAGRDVVPNSCVECHRGVQRGSWPDYRFSPASPEAGGGR